MTSTEARQALCFVDQTLIKVNREHARFKLVVQVYDMLSDVESISVFSRSLQKEEYRRVESEILRLQSRLKHYKRVLQEYLEDSDD